MLINRDIISDIQRWLKKPEIIVLLGARQVGKTSIMELLMQRLNRKDFFYFDLEDVHNLEILSTPTNFLNYLKIKGITSRKRIIVFIDEIQYLPQATKFLKIIHDHHPQIKLVVSGSSSFELRRKMSDALTGRKIVIEIYPLSFGEFLRFKKHPQANIKKDLNLDRALKKFKNVAEYQILTSEILPVFEEFLIFGGYPLPTLTEKLEDRVSRLKEVHNTYLQKDIKDLAHIENLLQFNRLVTYLALQISSLFNVNEVGKEVGLKRRELERYLFILEKTFVLKLLSPFYRNKQKELTKMSKLFFIDAGLRNININDLRKPSLRQDLGVLAENCFFIERLKRRKPLEEIHFWRTKDKKEVDFVLLREGEIVPIEVKYQAFDRPRIPSSLRSFIRKYQPPQAVVLTRDYLQKIKRGQTNILFIPLWMAC